MQKMTSYLVDNIIHPLYIIWFLHCLTCQGAVQFAFSGLWNPENKMEQAFKVSFNLTPYQYNTYLPFAKTAKQKSPM